MTKDLHKIFTLYMKYVLMAINICIKNYGTDYIFTTKQLKGVLAHLKRKGLGYEVYKVSLNILDKVEV